MEGRTWRLVERGTAIGAGAWSCLLVLALLVLGVPLLGCAGERATTQRTSGRQVDTTVLAARINSAQAVIDRPSAVAAGLQRAARTQQLEFGKLVGHPSYRGPVLARLSPAARSAALTALRAADALARLVPAERRLPRWRIQQPPTPRVLFRYFMAAATEYQIPWPYLAAIELVETRMGRIHGLSSAGAQGPMQFMPATWAEYGKGSINNQRNAIMAAARFLAANGGRRRIANALFHYNPSDSYVIAVESYAHEMRQDERAFYGYYFWQVLYRTVKGTYLLPVGYPRVRAKRLPDSVAG
jgi:transglycosylase-like protein with SLT domain